VRLLQNDPNMGCRGRVVARHKLHACLRGLQHITAWLVCTLLQQEFACLEQC
jgi:hypothetical protein